MSAGWPLVSLGNVLTHRKQFITLDDTQTYKRCRVQLHVKGVVLRDAVSGTEIKTKQQQVCRAGEFLVAEIDAKVGGFGIVPEELNGAVVSSHYFLFEIDASCLERRWLHFMTQTPQFREQVAAQGSTNYAAIRPHDVLGYQIPLPPISEQRRIVGRIEALAGKIKRARELRDGSAAAVQAVQASASNALFAGVLNGSRPLLPLGDVAEIRSGVTLGRDLRGQTARVPYLRVANVQDGHFNLNVMKEVDVLPAEVEKWLLMSGDVLLTEGGDWDKLGRGAVWEGQITCCIHQNHIFRVRVDPTRFDPYYLAALMASPHGKTYFQAAAKRTTNLASINQKQLKAFPVACIPFTEQRRIVAELDGLQAKVDAVKALQAQTQAELDALLPSVLDRAFRGAL